MRERIRRRLEATQAPADPVGAALAGLDAGLAGAFAALRLIPAAVLVPVVARPDDIHLLFTRRTAHLRDHAGQVSFPGGRVEPGDDSPAATALREAAEEVGLPAGAVEVLGYLPPRPVVTGFVVTPVVGLVAPDLARVAEPREVAEIFEAPVGFFAEPGNRLARTRTWGGVEFPTHEYHYRGRRVWGATAQIIADLLDLVI